MLLRRLAGPCYFIALLLVLIPATDFISNVWPLQPGDFRWRFGMTGLLAGFLLTPMLGIVLAGLVAAMTEDHGMLRLVSMVAAVGAVILVMFVALFALDVVQFRPEVPADRRGPFDFANVRSIVKHLLAAGSLGWLARSGLGVTAEARAGKGKPARATATHTMLKTQ